MFAQIPNFKYGNFQHNHKKVNSKLFKNLTMEASMLVLNFDELNTNFENFCTIKVGNK
jgi:hypothetical protein